MVFPNDAMMEPIRNSIQVLTDAILPLRLGIQKAAKDFESCWGGLKISSNDDDRNRGKRVFPVNELSCCAIDSRNCSTKEQIHSSKKRSVGDGEDCVMSEGKKKALLVKVPFRTFLGMFSLNLDNFDKIRLRNKVEVDKKGSKESDSMNKDGSCVNCLQLALTWSLLVNGFVRAIPNPFKNNKKLVEKVCDDDRGHVQLGNQQSKAKILSEKEGQCLKVDRDRAFQDWSCDDREGQNVSLECLIRLMFEQLVHNLKEFDQKLKESNGVGNDRDTGWSSSRLATALFDNLRAVVSIWEDRKVDINGFLGNLSFAKVGGLPKSVVGVSSLVNEEGDNGVTSGRGEENGSSSAQKLVSGIIGIPLPNLERLKSTLSTISLLELVELVPYLGRASTYLGRASTDHPDKKKLISVQDFFRYTELEGRRFFEELDIDGDGQVTMEDLAIAMRKRKLPRRYAREFMQSARSHLFSKSFGWKQFLSLMEQREPTILRAYTSLCLSKSGTLQKSEILASLKNAGLPVNEENAIAMMRFLKADSEESISYGHFRNFMLLLPSDRLQDDPRSIWFEAATVVPVAPPVEIPAGSVLRSALAGGLSCALSCCLLHPVDTIKTRVQASTLTFPEVISKLPQIGVRALYRGSVPAIWGQFTSHGLRTGIFEASKVLLVNVVPTLPELQVQSAASFCSTFLGTAVRIPCEVLKQRLQAGLFDNVGEAIVGTWKQDGVRGFFRGTGATLCREVPFYVAGMGLYAESKKMVQQLLNRELEPWETIMVGAISGGLAALVTTPFDVMKTRMMTAPQGRAVSMAMVAFSIVRHEGPLGLFKGAIPRFFWIAPLGAMNFAGYELARKAMERNEEPVVDQQPQKKLTSTG